MEKNRDHRFTEWNGNRVVGSKETGLKIPAGSSKAPFGRKTGGGCLTALLLAAAISLVAFSFIL